VRASPLHMLFFSLMRSDRRKVAAMGGMSAQIPIKGDAHANGVAMSKVKADKLREVTYGHDGTWIAHPLICDVAMKIFNEHMPGANQYHVRREEFQVSAAELLNSKVKGAITAAGVHSNVSAALAYSSSWISGNGCIPLNHLMEDAATAEIARVQLWQWCRYAAVMDTGDPVTPEYVGKLIAEVSPSIPKLVPGVKEEHVRITSEYLKSQVHKQYPSEFLTSDLMHVLQAADGLEGNWQRAQL
jgi:malate synthase